MGTREDPRGCVAYKVVEPCIQYYRLGYYDQSTNQSILSVICIHHAIFLS